MSKYAYRPWADDDEPSPLDEMSGADLKKALGNYKKMLDAGELNQTPTVSKKPETNQEWADRTDPTALDLVMRNHPTLTREKALELLKALGG